ncbi:hypothetical protein CHS0354_042873 [Potamilus streckersoni]|uniref:CUB domain-containing protein n=1 Tax=Potamilus streckersoni TaxID=2493646 RepID=A0AAE0T5W7_9BIVA|nr:hypothetical protein CHS0354_042873 [Potamilus streckersoni]
MDQFSMTKLRNVSVQFEDDGRIKVCTVILSAIDGNLFRATLNINKTVSYTNDCEYDYILLGNDIDRIQMKTLTSYKFCGDVDVREEVVSRNSDIWVMFSTKITQEFYYQMHLAIAPKEICKEGQFSCSLIQCIPMNHICDGIIDCSNELDEYCSSSPSVNAESSFRCSDGVFIEPRLPRASENWGQPLWYLCDGQNHCRDGSDERKDICSVRKSGVRDLLSECGSDLHPASKFLVWKDEMDCSKEISDSIFEYQTSVIIVVCSAMLVILGFIVFLRREGIQRKNTNFTESTGSNQQTKFKNLMTEDEEEREYFIVSL